MRRSRFLVLSLLAACSTEPARPPEPAASEAKPAEAPKVIAAVPIVPAGKPAPAAPADSERPAVAADSRAARFEALRDEYEKAMNDYYALFRDVKTDEEARKVSETAKAPDRKAYGDRLQVIFDEDPADATAWEILEWSLGQGGDLLERKKASAALEKFHFEREELESLVARLDLGQPDIASFVTKLSESSPHAAVRGNALYALATQKKEDAELIRSLRELSSEEDKKNYEGWLGAERMQALSAADPEHAQGEAITLFKRVEKEHGDVAVRKGTPYETTLGKRAKAEIFEMENLVPGKPAPEILGEDVNGVAFKLSDYRGKVVMLDFWGFW